MAPVVISVHPLPTPIFPDTLVGQNAARTASAEPVVLNDMDGTELVEPPVVDMSITPLQPEKSQPITYKLTAEAVTVTVIVAEPPVVTRQVAIAEV